MRENNFINKTEHSDGFKQSMVARLAQGEAVKELAKEAGVSTTTIYNWRDAEQRGKLKERTVDKRFSSLRDLGDFARSRASIYQPFPDSFKREVIRQIKELGVRPSELLKSTGISQAALYRWLKDDEEQKGGLPARQPRTQQDYDSLVIAYLRAEYRNARYQVQLLATALENLLDSLEPRDEDKFYHDKVGEARVWLDSVHPEGEDADGQKRRDHSSA